MKHLLITALLLALAACDPGTSTTTNIRQPAVALTELQGQWVVINYWAQWCKPCIKEIPELNQLHAQHEQVSVLGVNYDGATGDELQAQLSALGVAFPTLSADPASLLGSPRPVVLPTTLILDPAGKLVQTLVGPQTLASLRAVTIERPAL